VIDNLTMSRDTLIVCDDVNRLEVLPADGPRGWTWSAIVKFKSFYPVSTSESPSPNQDVDSGSQLVSMVLFDRMDAQMIDQTVSLLVARNHATWASRLNDSNVTRQEPARLVLRIQGARNSGALSLEPFEMSGLNFQVSISYRDMGSVGARKIE